MNLTKTIFRLLLGRRLPTTSGTLNGSGIRDEVIIRRDSYGIPHIEAQNEQDAWYGLGFCQGQDRSFQIETLVRAVHGTLTELVGPRALDMDRLSRRIGYHYYARKQLPELDDQTMETIEAFVRGVNDGRDKGCRRVPHEFALLRTKPTPYKPEDVIGMLKLISFTLASNWDLELARLKILNEDGYEALKALDPVYPEWLPVSAPPGKSAGKAVDKLSEDMALLAEFAGTGGGSNNWALAASRTATGRPLLANDPHLAPTLPPHWYLAHLRTPEWAVAGATFIATPAFAAGHNGNAAWGITAGFTDNTDLFIERMGPDGKSVLEGDRFVPCETRAEVIQVKGGDPITEEILVTRRGPIIGPALDGEVGAVSMCATWLTPKPVKGLLRIYRAQSFEEFRRAFESWPALPLNMAYADSSGSLGFQLVGEAPVRRKGWGTLPMAGWDPEAEWEEQPVPFDQMPHLSDPETGFIATANNPPLPVGEGPFLGVDWSDGYRVARICEALEARTDWDLPAVQRLQLDQHSIPWREMREIVLAVPAQTDEVRLALDLLKDWDGNVSVDSPAASVFEFFIAEMLGRLVRVKAPRSLEWALGKGFTPLNPRNLLTIRRVSQLVSFLREQPDSYFENAWPVEMADALATTVRTLRKRYGTTPKQWAWGRIRPLTLIHPVGEKKPFDRIFNLGPFPWGGDSNTVGQASVPPSEPLSNPLFIASLRMVIDVGNWEANAFSLPGGQSGNPLSPHYDDLFPLWKRGEGVPIAWSSEEVKKTARSTLRLKPA